MPAALEAATLPDALADVAREWSELNGIPVEVTVTGNVSPLHPEIEVALLRIAQEALANVARHAGATRAGLTLSFMGDVVTLDVRDDGVGLHRRRAPDGAARSGFGLSGMRQRVARVAGLAGDRIGAGRRARRSRPGSRRSRPARRRQRVSPIRLLIVDDHPVVRDGLRGMLAGDPDFEVVGEAADGAEALALVADARSPTSILMDLRMPGIGGAAAIQAARASGRRPGCSC